MCLVLMFSVDLTLSISKLILYRTCISRLAFTHTICVEMTWKCNTFIENWYPTKVMSEKIHKINPYNEKLDIV